MSITLSPFDMAALAANIADDVKAKDIVVLNTMEISSLADYFVIASVDSRTQMSALADHLTKAFRQRNMMFLGEERDKSGHWTLLDFGDIVIHLFHPEERQNYCLERFWSHATEVPRHLWLAPSQHRQAS